VLVKPLGSVVEKTPPSSLRCLLEALQKVLANIVVMAFQATDKFRMAGGRPHRMVRMMAFKAFRVLTDAGMDIRKLPDGRPVHSQVIAPPQPQQQKHRCKSHDGWHGISLVVEFVMTRLNRT
jgi:hypothetical protein